ncbi:glycosyltransferase family 2 protein [Marinibacterium profundimaris]|uniref:glycosyltransferase family 2 protein n=1 Tax=Marinibacterium profundimaris TaxID=1679460 RepID=UPI001303E281|nr:glycosyltransferase [Marinibacterium profundimaris]
MARQITAIVPTFNRSTLLIEALDALDTQTRPPAQVIVWDDGSTDGTAQAVAEVQGRSSLPILYKRAENGGKSRALNAALALADQDYIWICDDDDAALPDAAERLGAVLDSDTADIAAGRHQRFSVAPEDGRREITDTGYWPDPIDGSILRHTLEDIFFFQNATFVRRGCYDRVGPFDTGLKRSIDYDMTVRLLARFPAELVPETVFLQRKHDGLRGPADAQHAAARSEDVWRKTDREIFAKLRSVLPLSLYEAMYDSTDPTLTRRAALLQRGTVYARRCDWSAALEDFEAAADAALDRPLTDAERGIVIRAMAGKHGIEDVLEADFRGRIAALSTRNAAGREIARQLSRGMLWRVRNALTERDAGAAMRLLRHLIALPPALSGPPVAAGADVNERRKLPQEAYQW